MQQSVLNNLAIGEKAVDMQEHFHGSNGEHLVYKVTVYSCVKSLFGFKRIKKYAFPFYFASKEFAESFLQHYDSFEIYDHWFCDMWGEPDYVGLFIKPINAKKTWFDYRMIDTYKVYNGGSDVLRNGGVWDGIVNYITSGKGDKPLWSNSRNMSYLDILNKEKLASKEGTDGETFSYKLQKI